MIEITSLDKCNLDDYIKDFFIGFYQNLFYINKSEFKYDPDKRVSRINIADQFAVDDLTPEFKPTIYIRRHPFSFVNTSIDQFFGGSLYGASAYGDLIAGSVEVVCVSSVELEACRLASMVFLLTNQFKNTLCKDTGMYKVDVKTLGEAQPIQVASTMRIVEVPVLVQIMFQYNWKIIPDETGPMLSEIVVGRATDVVKGEPLTAVSAKSCDGSETGLDIGAADGNRVKICIPMTAADPTD